MAGTGVDYTLTASDTAAFCALLRAQGDLGPARQSPGQAQCWDFFAAIHAITYDHYRFITSAQIKGWVDKLFAALPNATTCYGIHAAGLYVLYAYTQFAATCFSDSQSVDESCTQGFPANPPQWGGSWPPWNDNNMPSNASPWNPFIDLWQVPKSPSPAGFFNALGDEINTLNAALIAANGQTPTVALLENYGGTSPDSTSVQRFEQSRFDPANWTDAGTFVQNLADTGLWQEQHDAMATLLQQATLTADAYYFLLHLLIALPTGDATSQQLAAQLASAVATSPEYPNDTFANQLVYLALLCLADPLGAYGWNNAQLQGALNDLAGAIQAADPASAAIQASLAQHGKLLYVDAAYPMHDPYCPGVGFTQRVTDTLFALDKARAGLNQ